MGLLTGDISINRENASVLVLTTEVYRNMLYDKEERSVRDVHSVILDEFHYMNDRDRGTVWEVRSLFLSCFFYVLQRKLFLGAEFTLYEPLTFMILSFLSQSPSPNPKPSARERPRPRHCLRGLFFPLNFFLVFIYFLAED